MLMRKPTYRQFEYLPRYYKPEKDKGERRRQRFSIKFRAQRNLKRNRPAILYILIFAIILYFYLALTGIIK